MDPDSKGSDFDWWSKYYASNGDEIRIQTEYIDAHHDTLQVGVGIKVSAHFFFVALPTCTRVCSPAICELATGIAMHLSPSVLAQLHAIKFLGYM